jgi:hypothetical protein
MSISQTDPLLPVQDGTSTCVSRSAGHCPVPARHFCRGHFQGLFLHFRAGRWFGFWLGGAPSLAGHGRGRVCFSFARCILRTDTGACRPLNQWCLQLAKTANQNFMSAFACKSLSTCLEKPVQRVNTASDSEQARTFIAGVWESGLVAFKAYAGGPGSRSLPHPPTGVGVHTLRPPAFRLGLCVCGTAPFERPASRTY